MDFSKFIKKEIFSITESNFDEIAIKTFQYQAMHNIVYSNYLKFLKIDPSSVTKLQDIPFLPIEFFKNFEVKTGKKPIEIIFQSSGTTGHQRSQHFVADAAFYKKISIKIFESFFGSISQFAFIALLPSYAERNGSSLIYMVEHFIGKSAKPDLPFYLNNYEEMLSQLSDCKAKGLKTILIGISFALLDLAEQFKPDLQNCIVMETGGMKGKRKEMVRESLHEILNLGLNTISIASEYGMTELLSQAYAPENGEFSSPFWMKIMLRNTDDPFDKSEIIKRGGVNIIDLANIDSCAFVETKDLGEILPNGKFKILGRFDNSEIRGCNLLI